MAQAGLVVRALEGAARVEIVRIQTTGDRLSAAGSPIEWKGDFTKELDRALLDGQIDLAVHSLKDVPSAVPPGLLLAAVPPREDPSDVLVSHPRRRFGELPPGARLGTSSPRRRAQIAAARPDLEITDARGNVDTRLTRLREGSLLAALEAGCHAPVAGRARVSGEMLSLDAGVFAFDGSRGLRESASGTAADPEALGRAVAAQLLARGAAELLAGAAR
jgi:hydroxymethylbilane synthase